MGAPFDTAIDGLLTQPGEEETITPTRVREWSADFLAKVLPDKVDFSNFPQGVASTVILGFIEQLDNGLPAAVGAPAEYAVREGVLQFPSIAKGSELNRSERRVGAAPRSRGPRRLMTVPPSTELQRQRIQAMGQHANGDPGDVVRDLPPMRIRHGALT